MVGATSERYLPGMATFGGWFNQYEPLVATNDGTDIHLWPAPVSVVGYYSNEGHKR